MELTAKGVQHPSAHGTGHAVTYEKTTVIVKKKPWGTCLCVSLVAFLLVVEAVMIFFLIPRDPCVSMKAGSATASSYSPVLTTTMELTFSWSNPSYVTMGFQNLVLDIYYEDTYITTATKDLAIDVPARDKQDVVIEIDLNSSSLTTLAPCIADLVTDSRCLLNFKGVVEPRYMGYALPTVPVSFEQYITR